MAAGAKPSAAHRVFGVPFDLLDRCNLLAKALSFDLDFSFGRHHSGNSATSGSAFLADARVPFLNARYNLLLRNQQRDDLLGLLAACTGYHAARSGADQLEEVAAVYTHAASVRICGMPTRSLLRVLIL